MSFGFFEKTRMPVGLARDRIYCGFSRDNVTGSAAEPGRIFDWLNHKSR